MKKSKVAVIRCNSYNQDEVNAAVKKGINLLGGIKNFISEDEKVLIKPNFLTAKKPDEAVTTHPSIFSAVIDELRNQNINQLYYGDSPGFGNSELAAKVCGFSEIADAKNVELLEFNKGKSVDFPEGYILKKLDVADGVLETDCLISLSKMKTHGMTRLTGAIKNQFGIIYGLNKASFHSNFPDILDFSKALIDINRFVKPRLYIMDGIVAMEGNGPKNGTPVNMNVLLFSNDPVALDTVFSYLVNIEPSYLPTIQAARELDFGESHLEDIEILGDDLETLRNFDFKVERIPARGENANNIGFNLLRQFRNQITRKPILDEKNCISCGVCYKHCPQNPKAIEMVGNPKKPKYDYSKCIRCFCCQELCPNNAIKIKTPFLGKLLLYR